MALRLFLHARSLACALWLAATLAALAPVARAADAVPEMTERPVIAEVVLELPPGDSRAVLEPLVALRAGEQLTTRDARRTVQLLYQLGRYANVVIRTQPLPDGRVTVRISCIPRRLVRELRIVNEAPRPALSSEAVARIAGLQPGQELWAGRAERAAERVRAELERRGFRSARVLARAEGEPNAEVVLTIDEGEPVRVTTLTVQGDDGPARAAALAAARLRPGAVLDSAALVEDGRRMREALHAAGYLQARVGKPSIVVDGDAARITVSIEPGPLVAVRFAGNVEGATAELRQAANLDPGQPLDGAALDIAAARLRTWYQLRGHALAQVEASDVAVPGLRTITFKIDEGPRYRVSRLTFTGAEHLDVHRLREQLVAALAPQVPTSDAAAADAERAQRAVGSRNPRRARRVPPPGEAWEPSAWEEAIARVLDQVRSEGFLDAVHAGTRVTMDSATRTVEVEVELTEGPRTYIESVELEGTSALPRKELDRLVRVRPKDPFSFAAIEETRAGIAAHYAAQGFVYARVDVAEELTADHTSARLRFRVDEGPRVRIANVVLSGNRRTRDEVVRDAIALRTGDVYAQEAVAKSQAQLLRLGVFRSVGLRLSDPEIAESDKDLTVDLAERPWRSLAPGIGFSIANGPRAFVELVQPNLFGRAIEGTARAKVNYPLETFRADLAGKEPIDRVEGRIDLGLHDPRFRLLPLPAGARLDIIGERIHRRAYDLTRGSAIAAIDLAPAHRMSLSLQYEIEIDQVLKSDALERLTLTRADVERLRFPEGYTTLHAFRPVFALDFRDNSVQPRRGWHASSTIEWAHSIGAGRSSVFGIFPGSDVYSNMLKLSGSLSGYLPLGSRSVFALSVRAGRVLPLNRDSRTIGPKRFYMGGASSMRGYAEDEMLPEDVREIFLEQVRACQGSPSGAACSEAAREIGSGRLASEGGESYYLGKAELRVPLSERFEAGLFADAGNLWLNPRRARLADVRYNVGVGLRIATPVGPAVVDLGFNIEPDERLGEDLVAPHFSIGVF
jgi:outer membrane protein assembly complex protein YaeT